MNNHEDVINKSKAIQYSLGEERCGDTLSQHGDVIMVQQHGVSDLLSISKLRSYLIRLTSSFGIIREPFNIMEVSPTTILFDEKHMDTPLEQNKFDKLVTSLSQTLRPSSGLTLNDADVPLLMRLMKHYDSREDCNWAKYAFSDKERAYTRNLVDEGGGKSNLLVIVWSPGKGSPIHDHGNAHCLMKILRGNLTETRYAFPRQGHSQGSLNIISEKSYSENEVAYIADELGLHRMFNKGSDYAVSLHLYTPPHVARKGCYVYDEWTGRRKHVPGSSYHSVYGRLLEKDK